MKNNYKNLFDLSGKTAIVTGAGGILGKHFCYGLAESGASIALVDIIEEPIKELSLELNKKYDVKASSFICDVSDPESVKNMVGKVSSKFGRIDILHNNAAAKSNDLKAYFARFEDYTIEQWRKITAVNLDGMFLVAQAVGNFMIEEEIKGSIVQTSSIYGIMAPDQRIYEGSSYLGQEINTPAVYSVTKSGVIALTKYLATYWSCKGIRVNAIAPGGIESGQNDEFKIKYSNRVPLSRMAKPEEIVGALLYLASDASNYVTGQTLIVDGGLGTW